MPEPLHPDTPWWSNLVAVLVTAVVTFAGTVYFMYTGGSGQSVGATSGGIGSLIKDTLIYIPHALLLYGVIADMITQEGVYSIASLIGLLSLIVHLLFKFIWKGTYEVIEKVIEALSQTPEGQIERANRPASKVIRGDKSPMTSSSTQKFGGAAPGSFFSTYTGCDVQGLPTIFHSPYAPQTLVIIATIFSYYGFDLFNNRGASNATATIILGTFFFLTQLFLMGDCAETTGLSTEPSIPKFIQGALAAIEGLFVGGVSYSVVQAYYPNRLPSSTISPFPRMTPNMLKDGKFDKDGNPWVCVNGVCYPDMSSQESRKAFADMVAASTGNGRAAVSEDCPAA